MKKHTVWIYRIGALVTGIGTLIALIYFVGFKRFLGVISQTSPYWIAASIVVYGTSWIFRTWRLKQFTTHAGKKIKIFDSFKLYISGYALNAILPARLGDAAIIGYLRMKGINIGRSAAIILQTRLLDIMALILLSVPALVLFSKQGGLVRITSATVFCILVLVIPACIVIFDKSNNLFGLLEKLENKFRHKLINLIIEKIKDAYEGYREIVRDKKLLTVSILLSLIVWLLEGLTCYMIAVAVGAQISVAAVILAVSMGNVGKSVPITPGGIGIYESILTAVLVSFGLLFDVAVVIAMMDHVIKKMFNLIVGVPATAGIGIRIAQILRLFKTKDTDFV